jgi:hypothetical protein
MIEIIRTLFKPVSTYTLGAYRGKHILENKIGRYVSEDEFIKIMKDLGYKMNSKNQFKIAEYKPRKSYPPDV